MAVRIEVSFDDAGAKAAFARLEALGANLKPLMEHIGAGFVHNLSRRHETQTAPDGRAWKPNRRGGVTLTDSGILADSWNARAAERELTVGTPVPYAAVHQDGAVIVPKTGKALRFQWAGGWATVKKVTIPARPMLGIGQAEREVTGDAVRRAVAAALRDRGAGS